MGAPLLCSRGHRVGNAARIAELVSAVHFGGAVKLLVKEFGEWAAARALFPGLPTRARTGAVLATKEDAERFKSDVRKGIMSGAPGGRVFAALSPLTTALHGRGRGILRRSEQMLSEIAVVRRGNAFAVVVRGGRSRIANIHEHGRLFKRRLTRRQLRWLFAAMRAAGVKPGVRNTVNPTRNLLGQFLSKGQQTALVGATIIPPRPFFAPVYARYRKNAREREERLMRLWMTKIRGK